MYSVGRAAECDLPLSDDAASREHVQIRLDQQTGKFFIKDLSTYGTSVDGKKLTPSMDRANGAENDLNIEAPLPAKAKISLAGVLPGLGSVSVQRVGQYTPAAWAASLTSR